MDTKEEVKEEVETMDVDYDAVQKAQKNTTGELGPICNYCGGYGFTLAFGTASSSAGCPRCFGTGVEPVNTWQLQTQVIDIAKQLNELKQLILTLAPKQEEDKKDE